MKLEEWKKTQWYQDRPEVINAMPGKYTVLGYSANDLVFIQENPSQIFYEDDEGDLVLATHDWTLFR